jgi:hypothetical protein
LRGVEAVIAFVENDSGNIAAATRDAKRADRFLKRGADQLRAAGRVLGTRIGDVDGYWTEPGSPHATFGICRSGNAVAMFENATATGA